MKRWNRRCFGKCCLCRLARQPEETRAERPRNRLTVGCPTREVRAHVRQPSDCDRGRAQIDRLRLASCAGQIEHVKLAAIERKRLLAVWRYNDLDRRRKICAPNFL